MEGRTLAQLAVHIDITAMLFYNAISLRQAQACALPDWFCRKEGLKDMRHGLRWDTLPTILDRNANPISGRDIGTGRRFIWKNLHVL